MKKTEEKTVEVTKKKIDSILPEGVKIIGMYKLKDKPNRGIVSFKINGDVEGIIIQKVKGQTNKIIVAVKLFTGPKIKIKEETKKDDKTKEKTKS
jgi:hypothetical protein